MKSYLIHREKWKILFNRVTFLVTIMIGMFLVIIYQFYQIQIIDHDYYAEQVIYNVQRTVELEATRGLIYDRYGKPLVTNKVIHVLQFNPEVKFGKNEDSNETLLKVIELLEAEGCDYIDFVPISKTQPFTFTGDASEVKEFIRDYVPYTEDNYETITHYSAEELMAYLTGEKVYDLSDKFSDNEKRKILGIRIQISKSKYWKYKKVTIAEDVNMNVVAAIEENKEDYPAISAEIDSVRYYPEAYSKPLGNIIGYMRKITQSQYEDKAEQGYSADDLIGQVGIEGQFESTLRGINGSQTILVDISERTKKVTETVEAIKGNDVYLTIDADLQVAVYQALEKRLSEGIISRLEGVDKSLPLTPREILVSMAESNQLDFSIMNTETASQVEKEIYQKVNEAYIKEQARLNRVEKNKPEDEKTQWTLKMQFARMLEEEDSPISDRELLLAFDQQGTFKLTEEERNLIAAGDYSLVSLIIRALEEGRIKPDQMSIMPCSGTAVVVDSNTGQTLALVSYPSYDSNEFTQNFNKIYRKINDGVDKRSIEYNRALKTVKAPGSTFKMITGLAGLEEEVVSINQKIYDSGQFTKAGDPPLRCWIFTNTGHGHGDEDIEGALEVSCNYYFNDVVYELGEKFGAPYGGIKVLSQYAEKFGLGEKSGIELDEAAPNISNPTNAVNTQASRALNRISGLNEQRKENLYNELVEYCDQSVGFYTLGNSEDLSLEGQVDYLSRPFIKKPMDVELEGVLLENNNLKNIMNRLLEDYETQFSEGVATVANEITDVVMNGDNGLSLKYRLKCALSPLLKEKVQENTKKAIRKALAAMPEGVMDQILLEGYQAALEKYQGQEDKKEACRVFNERIAELEKGTFDSKSIMIDKILDRIINVYLDDFFKNVEMEWTTRDNISSAIGQGEHTFTAVQMARYMAGLANGKNVYNLTILNGIYDHKQKQGYMPHEASIYNVLNFKEENIHAIHEGMHKVVAGNYGTARKYFEGFPIEIAAKTGTAQENLLIQGDIVGSENTWITSFAPYAHPEVAVVSSMYGTNGLGNCTYNFVKDVYSLYFQLDQEKEKVTLKNHLLE